MNAPRHRDHEYSEEHPNRPKYFPDITLGNIIAVVTILGSVAVAYAANESRITKVETEQAAQKEMVTSNDAQISERIAKLEAKIEKVDDKIDLILLRMNPQNATRVQP